MLRSGEEVNAGAEAERRVPKSLASEKRIQDPSVLYVAFTSKEDPGKEQYCRIRLRASKGYVQTSYRA
jgi:hypothetical protein